jgi:membrane protease YdiL (CAAX protease family)
MSLSPDGPPEYTPNAEAPPTPEAVAPLRRIPHIGHAAIFIVFAVSTLGACGIVLALLGKSPASLQTGTLTLLHPNLQIAALAGTYLTTLTVAWFFFPILWGRSFLDGIQWNWSTARAQAGQLIALGFVLGLMMQIVTYFITAPKTMPVDQFFLTPSTAWLITIFGTVGAPVFEEICFRGFLVPAFAIAYDWLSLPRTPGARSHWQTTTALTPLALIFSAILSSLCFAMMHAEQVAHIWAVIASLFCISLVLTFVRVKTQSVAASTLVHSAYNGFVFLALIFATGGYRHLDRMTH